MAASTTASAPASGTCLAAASTAAAAVVLAPLESSITETRIGPKNVRCTCASSASPAATSEPPIKIAVRAQVVDAAREHGAVDQVAHLRDLHVAVAKQLVDAGIDRHHGVEHAGLRVAIELHQDLGFAHRGCSLDG